jgi:CheY-like chemotaxis protein
MMPQILVIEDNPVNMKLVCELLGYEGYRMLHATDAEEAIGILQQSVPDLILMDIALPGMDGLTLTRKIKADAKTAQVPVVALTAFAMKGDNLKAVAAGCDGYITKPINTRELPAAIAAFLGRAADGAESITHEDPGN